MTEMTFTLAEVLNAQKALREATGAEEEPLELIDVAGIASDEIELLQEKGKSWDDMAAMVQQATGKTVTGKELEEAYNSLEEDDSWDDEGYENS